MAGCRALSEVEFNMVKSHITNLRDLALFIVGIRTGFRISELLSLKVKDVYQDGTASHYIKVMKSNMKGKTGSRTVMAHFEARQIIELLIKEHGLTSENYLFKSRELFNAPITKNHANHIFKKAFKELGFTGNLSTHTLRKTFASRMVVALNGNIFKLQKVMGHKSPTSTVAYIELDQNELDQAILNVK